MSEGRPDALVHRVTQLLEQRRYEECEHACRELLARDPDDTWMLYLLAMAQYQQDGGEPRALETIDRAIALEPNMSLHHALRSGVLRHLDRVEEALVAADEAIRLAPDNPDGHVARGWALYFREQWADAEECARRALAIDPDDGPAAYLLSESLRLQGKGEENRDAVSGHLARDPLDPVAHVSAGWSALQRGDRDVAEQHFLEALRLDPRMDAARDGLLQSFKSRAPWYRAWLRLNLWMARFSRGNRWLIMIGLFVAARFARVLLRGPWAPLGAMIGFLWLGLSLWSHLASGTASALVLLDRRARLALRPPERLEAVFSGGGVFAGVALMLVGALVHQWALLAVGMGLFAGAIPFAHTFTNDSSHGRLLFGGLGALAVLAGLAVAASLTFPAAMPRDVANGMAAIAFVGVILSTWLANAPALNR
jgi:Tfp pilus assembly protein PilF